MVTVPKNLSEVVPAVILGKDIRAAVTPYAHELKRLADTAWNAAAAAAAKGDDITEAYERGKAHALCAALGDQPRLFGDLRAWEQSDTDAPSEATE